MTGRRVLFFITTILLVGAIGTVISLYARGYRFNLKELKFSPNGLFVIKSVPDGSQVFINGDLVTATNTTLALAPGTYDVGVKKDGYLDWGKRLIIDKEVVTEVTVHLFRATPSLSSVTFFGSISPIPSYDLSKIAYVVPPDTNGGNVGKEGLWVIEAVNLPIGFAQDPKRITDGNLEGAVYYWSPDSREIVLKTSSGSYLLNTGDFTPQGQRVNIGKQSQEVMSQWVKDRNKERVSQLKKLPDALNQIFSEDTSSMVFSPDEDMILYTASASATLPSNIVKQLPGASTQKQDRQIVDNKTYVYDIEEDRNFLITESSSDLVLGGEEKENPKRRLSWFPTSRHLVLAEADKVTILDYDGTNKQIVYTGSYVPPNAFATLSLDRLFILTNLGSNGALPNFYSLSLK